MEKNIPHSMVNLVPRRNVMVLAGNGSRQRGHFDLLSVLGGFATLSKTPIQPKCPLLVMLNIKERMCQTGQ